jgi:hypothetical protein
MPPVPQRTHSMRDEGDEMKRLANHRNVEFVDYDEPDTVIVTLQPGLAFEEDPGCGVRGFDTNTEALKAVRRAVERRVW